MQPEDIRECVNIIANHPVVGPRYGPTIKDLPEAWLRLLHSEAQITAVVRAGEGPRAPIVIAGVTAIVRDEFLSKMKTTPHFWTGPELTRRITNGESPLLNGKQFREKNSDDGLNGVCWDMCFRAGYEAHGELQRYIMAVFIQEHRGYRWKEVIASQAPGPDHLAFMLKTGGFLWDSRVAAYTGGLKKDLGEIAGQPHVVGITRDLELSRQGNWEGSWVGSLFDYHPPILGFSRSEQRLLCCALPGATDAHLAETLGISLPVVKKMWISIYGRIEDCLPDLIPDSFRPDLSSSSRGREKRRRVLAYLREHPEELRPFSRKLLLKAAQSLIVKPPFGIGRVQ
ncbi:MAG TPA: hypothetical protein VNV82_05090 [Bryobacteraceae bacterium]|jgi:hypothetical protein|nr:hypothetical protein [Bryobacteraceae bacterium]